MMTDHDRQRETGGHAWRDGGFDVEFDALAMIAYRVAFRVLGDRAEAEDISRRRPSHPFGAARPLRH